MLAALRTVHDMLYDRGYKPRKEYEWIDDQKKMVQRVQNKDMVLWADRKAPDDSLMVFFAVEPKLKVQKVRAFLATLDESKITHAILVYAKQVTPKAKEELRAYNVEMFTAAELYKNRLMHHLVPKHEMLSPQETTDLLHDFNLSSTKKLPRYRTTDPVVRYHNWPVGTVVRIFRVLGNQQEPTLYYRMVDDKA